MLENYIRTTMGSIDFSKSFGMALWANKVPGRGFLLHSVLAKVCTKRKLVVLLDDVLPRHFQNRSLEQQEIITRGCLDVLREFDIEVTTMTMIHSPESYQSTLVSLLAKINFSEFVRCLPKKKLALGIEGVAADEMLHTAAELASFGILESYDVGTLVIPRFAVAIGALYRNISRDPLGIVVTERFTVNTDFDALSSELLRDPIGVTDRLSSRN